MNEDSKMCVALVGNLSDGYGAVGPFEDFEDACLWTEGQESWIMTMQCPTKEYDDPKDADKSSKRRRNDLREALIEIVRQFDHIDHDELNTAEKNVLRIANEALTKTLPFRQTDE